VVNVIEHRHSDTVRQKMRGANSGVVQIGKGC